MNSIPDWKSMTPEERERLIAVAREASEVFKRFAEACARIARSPQMKRLVAIAAEAERHKAQDGADSA